MLSKVKMWEDWEWPKFTKADKSSTKKADAKPDGKKRSARKQLMELQCAVEAQEANRATLRETVQSLVEKVAHLAASKNTSSSEITETLQETVQPLVEKVAHLAASKNNDSSEITADEVCILCSTTWRINICVLHPLEASSAKPPAPVQPPPGCSKLLKFVGSCNDRGTAVFVGVPKSNQPTCVVVGKDESIRWPEGEEVHVKIDGNVVRGELVAVNSRLPWVALVELLEPLPLEFDRNHIIEDRFADEAVLVRDGVEIAGRLIVRRSQRGLDLKPMGVIPGARIGDVVVKWSKGVPKINAIVAKVEEDGSFLGEYLDERQLRGLGTLKNEWYYEKYPERVPKPLTIFG